MNIDSAVVFRYISPLYDHRIVCDWAKIMSKIGRKFAAFCRSHCSKLASAVAAKCGIMRVSPPPPTHDDRSHQESNPLCSPKSDNLSEHPKLKIVYYLVGIS